MDTSPSPKRVKLDASELDDDRDSVPKREETERDEIDLEQPDEEEAEHCAICLQSFLDKTIIPACAHEFCFDCLLLWSGAYRAPPSRPCLDSESVFSW